MFTILNTILLIVLLIQVIKCRRDIYAIDVPDSWKHDLIMKRKKK